jgi:hypothetical protein
VLCSSKGVDDVKAPIAAMSATICISQGFGTKLVNPAKKTQTTMRRTVKGNASSGPNWKLESPDRLWEIGSAYW